MSDHLIEDQSSGEGVSDRKLRIVATITYALLIFTNLRYNFGRRSPWDNGHVDDVGFTPFTAQIGLVVIYWLFLFFWQFVYLVQFFDAVPRIFNLVYIASNLMQLIWSYLFARSHYFLSEFVIILTFGLLLATFLFGRSYAIGTLGTRLVGHGSVVALPLAWSHYVVWWNGAVLFSARGVTARIIANFFIWEFLAAIGLLLLLSGDYILGLASAYLVFAIGVGQLFTKVFALQWIFAFIIASCLFVLSIMVAALMPQEHNVDPPRAGTNSEVAPLLGA